MNIYLPSLPGLSRIIRLILTIIELPTPSCLLLLLLLLAIAPLCFADKSFFVFVLFSVFPVGQTANNFGRWMMTSSFFAPT